MPPAVRAVRALVVAGLVPSVALGQEGGDFPSRGAYLGVTAMRPDADPQLTGQDGHVALAAGMVWRRSRHLAIDLGVLDTGQKANMPRVERSRTAPAGARNDAHINVDGIFLGVRLFYPLWKLDPYVGGGVGYYASEVSNLGALAHFVLPPDFSKRHDNRIGTHYLVGIEVPLSETARLVVEYRKLMLDANFGPEFGGKTKVGGNMTIVALRSVFR